MGGEKGGGYERDLSKELSLYWTNGERDDIFWRTSQSGGRAKSRIYTGQKTAYSYGDITFIDPLGKPLLDLAVIEAKRGYTGGSKKLKKSDIEKAVQKIQSARMQGDKKAAAGVIQRLFSSTKKGGGLDLLNIVDDAEGSKILDMWIERAELDCALAGKSWFLLFFRRDGKRSAILYPQSLHDAILASDCSLRTREPMHISLTWPDKAKAYVIMNMELWKSWVLPHELMKVKPKTSNRVKG